jgi:outer membrane biogenesis lipoprotein LolB
LSRSRGVLAAALALLLLSGCANSDTGSNAKERFTTNSDAKLEKNSRYDYDSLVGTLHAQKTGNHICYWVMGNRQGLMTVETRNLLLPPNWKASADESLVNEASNKVWAVGGRVRLEGLLDEANELPGCPTRARVFKVVDDF